MKTKRCGFTMSYLSMPLEWQGTYKSDTVYYIPTPSPIYVWLSVWIVGGIIMIYKCV